MKKKRANGIIYKVTNKTNNKIYIGASTKTIEVRKKEHLQKAKKGIGSSFQEALGTYKPEDFIWEQIDTANNLDTLAQKEVEYILKYDSNLIGYNSDCGGGFKKTVYQFNCDTGELTKSYSSLNEAADDANAVKQNISDVCLGINKTCKGFKWSYSCSQNIKSEPDLRKKQVSQYTLEDEYIQTYESISIASQNTKTNKSSIAKCCRGERKQAGGFIWKH